MRKKQKPSRYVGTVEAINFLRKHHGNFALPPGELFAFAQDPESDKATYVLVGERDPLLEIAGGRWDGNLDLDDVVFDALQATAMREASECRIKPPYSVTFVRKLGVFSFPVLAKDQKAVA